MTLKSFIWGLMGTMATLPAHADNVARSEALKQAQDFAATRGLTIQTSARQQAKAKMQDDGTALYFFDTEDDNGFIIVSGDDRARTILGYTTAGHYDEGQLPSNMQAWIDGYVQQISSLTDDMPRFTRTASTHPAVTPIVEAKWDQYGAACPNNYLAGCVAVAMAQSMYSKQCPASLPAMDGYKSRSGTEVASLPGIENFPWNQLKMQYDSEPSADDPVCLLLRYCGQSVQMDYTPSGSSASCSDAALALRRMGYASASHAQRYQYSSAEWEQLIYDELGNGHPVIYGGDNGNYSGHAFVCDGYDGNGQYHINWGWGGWYNGYFALDALNPDAFPYGYNCNQDAVVGIYPTNVTLPVKADTPFWEYNMTKDVLTCAYANVSGDTHDFDFGMGYESINGEVKGCLPLGSNINLPNSCYISADFPMSYFNLSEDGLYRLYPISKSTDADVWQSCYPSKECYAKVKRSNGVNVLVAMHDVNGTSQTFASIGSVGMATFWTDHVAVIPEGLTAYYAKSVNSGEALMMPVPGNVIPAQTGVIIKGEAGRYAFSRAGSEGADIASHLVGQEEEALMAMEGYKHYKLTADSKFHLDQEDGSIDCTVTNRAYLRLPASYPSSVKLRFEGDEVAVLSPTSEIQTPAYNLSGQRVHDGYHGIVIRGGKKVINK